MERILIRIDDVGYDAKQNRLIRELCKRELKLTCAVVPTWIETKCCKFLLRVASDFPGQVEIHQHGYAHLNHSVKTQYEFGPKRSFTQQYNDIIRGREILRTQFGGLFFEAFTPPYGFYDKNTLMALKQAGFFVISSLPSVGRNKTIIDITPHIDCFSWHPTKELAWDIVEQAFKHETAKSVKGFILHPRFMSDNTIDDYVRGINVLCRNSTWTLKELYDERHISMR